MTCHTKKRQQPLVWLALTGILGLTASALAQQVSIRLPADNPASQVKDGPGADVVRRDCALCHSLDYIVRQPRMGATAWDAEVQKMIRVYGAPIVESEARIIGEYLARNYGPEETPRQPSRETAP